MFNPLRMNGAWALQFFGLASGSDVLTHLTC
jgi:hypothetical protein